MLKGEFERSLVKHIYAEDEMKLEAIFSSSPDAIAVSDLNGNIIECNQAALNMHGYSSREELIGKNGFELIARKDHEKAKECLKKILEQGSIKNIEFNILTKDGREFPAEFSASVIKDSSGNATGFIAITKDITERKNAEQSVRESQQKFERLFRNIPDAAVYWDEDFRILDINPRFSELFGYSLAEIKGKRSRDFTVPNDKAKEAEIMRQKSREGYVGHESVRKRKDGSLVPVSISVAPIIVQGQLTGFMGLYKDITERKQAEQALLEEKAFSDSLINSLPDGLSVLDAYGVHINVNPAFCKMTGFSREELIGVGMPHPYWPPETRGKNERALLKALHGETSNSESTFMPNFEYTFMRKNGERFPVILSPAWIKDQQGNVISVFATVKDIKERKKAEKMLLESQQKFERLFKANPEATVFLDVNSRVVDINPLFTELFGYSLDEAKGKSLIELIVPKEKKTEAEMLIEKSKEGYFYFETFRATKQGTIIPVSITAAPIRVEDKLFGYILLYQDISERKKMEEKLRQYSEQLEELVQKRTEELLESEKRYSVLVEEASDGVVIHQNGKIVFANKKASDLVGYTKDEQIGLPPEKLVTEKYLPEVMEAHERRMRGEIITHELEVKTKTGESIPVETSESLITYQGHPAVLVIVRDIRERKRMEEQRLKLEKLAAVSELAMMVGHDLRNPLQSIENATYVLKNELSKCAHEHSMQFPQKAIEMFQVIANSANYADKIIRDLQDFSATRAPTLRKIDVNTLVEEALSQVEAPQKIELRTELSRLPEIRIDRDQIKRVFMNLILNGMQAMEKGGTLVVSTKKTDGFVEIGFKDTGVGISRENMAKLFKPFFTTKATGMGMGLPICRKFVENHGGSINVGSELGKGTTFTVKLPDPEENMGEN